MDFSLFWALLHSSLPMPNSSFLQRESSEVLFLKKKIFSAKKNFSDEATETSALFYLGKSIIEQGKSDFNFTLTIFLAVLRLYYLFLRQLTTTKEPTQSTK